MTQLYWQIYKNLEKEFLGLSEIIYIDDSQQNVYSMKIADLLIRTVIEIESISKELYFGNYGKEYPDNELYFDTICLNHLNNLWNLDKKIVLVVSPNIYFIHEENKVLRPLHKAMKRGSSSADWNKAYQAVKHNRAKELHIGNIKNLLHGLAALYVLNLYYNNKKIENVSEENRLAIDGSFGSNLFSVKIHRIHGLPPDGSYIKTTDYVECVYIEDYEPKSKEKALNAMLKSVEYVNSGTREILEKQITEKKAKGEPITQEWLNTTKANILPQLFPIKDYKLGKLLSDNLSNLHYNIVLNKQQY